MKLEIGGGIKPRGDGWVSIDVTPNADIIHDLDVHPWPLADEAVDEVYSSHCLEHLKCPFATFAEVCRVCKIGARVEIRVPHPSSDLAMTAGHTHVFSPIQAINMEKHFPREYWKGPKRMRLENFEFRSSFLLDEIKRDLPFLANIPNDVIMKWFGRTAHETVFLYTVIANEHL